MLFPRVGHSPGRCAWRPDLAKRRTRSQSQGGGGGRASNMLVVLLITGEIPHILVHKFIARGGRRRSQQSSSESHEQELPKSPRPAATPDPASRAEPGEATATPQGSDSQDSPKRAPRRWELRQE
ncbi:unnamed protein product [Effrenium voratum]|nr:unnamed protein product [Effrenium voratum]